MRYVSVRLFVCVQVRAGSVAETILAVICSTIDVHGAALDDDVVAGDLRGPIGERVDAKSKQANRRKKGKP
jgi:hypothetical protein